jgi:Leucine-rich repeat (LRR) protein
MNMQTNPVFSWRNFSWICFSVFCGLLISGCKNYSVSVNDNLVYIPPSIFKDYSIADQRLFDCVQQTIFDKNITRAEDLTTLNCSNAGIRSLQGLEKFFALVDVNLAENQIADITTIGALARLENLKLNDNQIVNPSPLLQLLHIKQLELQGNPTLDCRELKQVVTNLIKTGAKITVPQHCIH